MQITLNVQTTNGTNQVTTTLFNVISWERKYKSKGGSLASGIGAEDLAFLAFEAYKTAGLVVPAVFDDFAKTIISIDVVGQEEPNPTLPEATAAP